VKKSLQKRMGHHEHSLPLNEGFISSNRSNTNYSGEESGKRRVQGGGEYQNKHDEWKRWTGIREGKS